MQFAILWRAEMSPPVPRIVLQFARPHVSLCNAESDARRQLAGMACPVAGTVPAIITDQTRLTASERHRTMDLLYLGLTIGFFALSWAFTIACERLS